MKKIKKLLTIGLAVLLMLCMSVSLVGCKKTGPLPNGHYGMMNSIPEEPLPDLSFGFTQGDIRDNYGWVIDGDTAEMWVSGSCDYKAKIVEKDGVIYFEGYKYRTLLDILLRGGKKQGNTDVYLVEYDGKSIITLVPYAR
ncbi:MAG: hypothetical protein IJB97_08085 [Clostridia bacterium]|nr:hypothetical protein [Clostridia bacterium]